jgi:hypothetical protein
VLSVVAVDGLLVFRPIFGAGLVFGSSIKRSEDVTVDYGANLLGTTVGGVASRRRRWHINRAGAVPVPGRHLIAGVALTCRRGTRAKNPLMLPIVTDKAPCARGRSLRPGLPCVAISLMGLADSPLVPRVTFRRRTSGAEPARVCATGGDRANVERHANGVSRPQRDIEAVATVQRMAEFVDRVGTIVSEGSGTIAGTTKIDV